MAAFFERGRKARPASLDMATGARGELSAGGFAAAERARLGGFHAVEAEPRHHGAEIAARLFDSGTIHRVRAQVGVLGARRNVASVNRAASATS